jgi:hypothetical protein
VISQSGLDSQETSILQNSQIVTGLHHLAKWNWEVGKVNLQNSRTKNIHILWMSICEISFGNLQWMNDHG